MSFVLPAYIPPDFTQPQFVRAPDAAVVSVERDGVAPDHFHSTSMFPEYFKLGGRWVLAEETRMDCCVVVREDGRLDVVENRRLIRGDRVIVGRSDDGSQGIYLHATGFQQAEESGDSFVFRGNRSRETAFSRDYDRLYELLRYERSNGGRILWVMGPAFAFDCDARRAMQRLVENGFVQGLMAGNALATHDLEASLMGTALGQDIYTQKTCPGGHYHHLDVINLVRRSGSIPQFVEDHKISDGIMYSVVKHHVPFVLAGSIRDDGPLPEVISDVYAAQDAMRSLVREATTIICLATQLHTIATGNMTPSFRKVGDVIRPLYLYTVDISEFVVNKLADRGSLSALSFVTNAQDFIVHVANNVCKDA